MNTMSPNWENFILDFGKQRAHGMYFPPDNTLNEDRSNIIFLFLGE